jgi:hypothetical protein
MWHNLCCEKFSIGIAKHVLFFGKFSLQHDGVPEGRKMSGQQYGEHPAGQQ